MNDLIRFRCNRCNSSLKVAGAKAGTRVACPKCGLELIIPEVAAADNAGRSPTDDPPRVELAAASPADVVGIVASPAPPEPVAAPASAPTSVGFLNLDLRLDQPLVEKSPRSAETKMVVPPAAAATAAPAAQPVSAAAPSAAAPVSSTASEVTSIRGERGSLRTRDVVMPRAAVVGYTTFAILALFLAFIAGVMIGHFIWTTTPAS